MSNIPSREHFLFTESFDSLMNSQQDGGRNKPSPGDALHQEALDYLKTTLKLKDLEARAYKSIAYRHIKENNPDAKHFERAEKMLELVKSKNFVKEYKEKLAETMKILEDIDSEKAKRNSETASQASTEEKVSRRIRRQSGGYNINNFSETSVDANYTDSNMNKPYYNEYRAMKAQYLQSKLKQNGGNINNFSETSVDANYTDSNMNKPYYNEYRAMKAQYLQSKLKQNGGNTNNLSETSVMQNYTESNSNKPYYKEYLHAKKEYLEAKLKQNGGAFDMNKWLQAQPSYGLYPMAVGHAAPPVQHPPPGFNKGTILNPTSPLHDLTRFLEIIKEDLMPNLMVMPPPVGAAAAVPVNRERQAAIETFMSYVDDIRARWGF